MTAFKNERLKCFGEDNLRPKLPMFSDYAAKFDYLFGSNEWHPDYFDLRGSRTAVAEKIAEIIGADSSFVRRFQRHRKQSEASQQEIGALCQFFIGLSEEDLNLPLETFLEHRRPISSTIQSLCGSIAPFTNMWSTPALLDPVLSAAKKYYALDDLPFLTKPGWIPKRPIHLTSEADQDMVNFIHSVSEPLPLPFPGSQFGLRYNHLFKILHPERLLIDDPCFRILEVRMRGELPVLKLGPQTYLSHFNFRQQVAWELCRRVWADEGNVDPIGDSILPLRGSASNWDNFRNPYFACADYGRLIRNSGVGITTLVIFQDTSRTRRSADFIVQRRKRSRGKSSIVAVSLGALEASYSGVFQPLTTDYRRSEAECSIRFHVVKEYREELLADNAWREIIKYDGQIAARTTAALDQAEREERATLYFIGMGVDPLSFQLEIITVLVIRCHGDHVGLWSRAPASENDEGEIEYCPIDELSSFRDRHAKVPSQKAGLLLVERHIDYLLGR